MNEMHDKYAPSDIPISSFAQMGYLAGRAATEAMLGIKGDITKESVNAAFKALKNFSSDLWCKPWYFDSTVGSERVEQHRHHRDAAGRQDGADRGLLRHRRAADANPLAQIRAKEKELGLNTLIQTSIRPPGAESPQPRCRALMS